MIRSIFRLLLVVLLLAAGAFAGWHLASRRAGHPEESLAARLSQVADSAASLELLESDRADRAREVLQRGLRLGLEETERLSRDVRGALPTEIPNLEESVRRAKEYVRRHSLGRDLEEKAEAILERLKGAGPSPYAGLAGEREIAALADEEIASLTAGEGMGFALAAELHRYPGPKHVLELAEELELDAAQRAATERVFAAMRDDARRLGAEIVAAERELDGEFRAGRADAGTVERLTGKIGRLEGKLRAVHLAAHVEMRRILSAEQVERYVELRGYGGGGHDPSRHHPGGGG